ncbi:alpha/beta hydrolase family protein [Terriglobus sp. RCC_193]|uniref:alpha/beta hydrolase family protein n=1 Tax=Terriglobus sp. RCC_193 TaxID=3239218 RepID=UPI00352547D4
MLGKWYADWMIRWETALTTRDTNRVVRPLEWGFDWLADFSELAAESHRLDMAGELTTLDALDRMMRVNAEIVARNTEFYGYAAPADFRLEHRHPELFPTNVRPETLAQEQQLREDAANGKLDKAEFLRFTSPVPSKYPENDAVNARWYPEPAHKDPKRKKQAIVVMPQWNADAFSHNALCAIFNKFGIAGLRLSKPYHDIRRPAELERSDYAVSSNIGRTIAACRQAVVDIRACVDWLQAQGYEQFGVLGTSLGSCYSFMAAAFDPRIQVCAFNHASTWFGDVVWTGQSTRHIRAAFEREGLTQDQVRAIFTSISPMSVMDRFAAEKTRQTLVIYAPWDLTFLREFSLDVLSNFKQRGVNFVSRVLPCGHYTTGETPYKYIDGWYMGSFIHKAYKQMRERAV